MTTRDPQQFEASGRVQGFVQQFDYHSTDDCYGGHQENATLGGLSGAWSWFVTANHIDNRSQPMTWATLITPAALTGGRDRGHGLRQGGGPLGQGARGVRCHRAR